MSTQKYDKTFNSTFKEIQRWQLTEKAELVYSTITDNDTGEVRHFFNKQWTGKDGKLNRGNGSTIPQKLAQEVGTKLLATAATIG